LPAKTDPKRQRSGSLELTIRNLNPNQSSPVHEDRCCNCTKMSTCQTKRCVCFHEKCKCRSCDWEDKCQN
jgi:hypothetical protein